MKFLNDLWAEQKLTEKSFQDPEHQVGILPFWFWNGELDEQELEWQLKEYKAKGIPGLFIHGRFGLKVPYLSPEWFERVAFVVAKGKEIGLDIWIYDEMNWPSGTANRMVPQKYPHLRQKYLEMVTLWIDGPLFIYLEATDTRYVNTGDSRPVAAYACTAEEYQNGIKNVIDLTPNISFEKIVPWEAPPGKWVLMYFLEKEIDYYIDTLNPEATRKFIELTHEGYRKSVGSEFGKVVPGFYTDEPAMHYYQVGMDNFIIPWSSRMFKIFQERAGYRLKPYLPALYTDMGPTTARVRYDFWKALSDQYDEGYYRQLSEWCSAHNLIFTGHLMFEHWLRGHARCLGNIFDHLKNFQLVGVDHLYPKIGSEEDPQQHVELKVASSAAHHFGKNRLLCESMGGTYWDCTLERMKWIANWEFVLGVNIFNNHGYHYSVEGERKRDWPPSQFYHHTWWKYYDCLTTYLARLGHTLSQGRHVAKILVLYPINSIWANYIPQRRTPVSELIETDYDWLSDALLRLHWDFDYVDENILNQAKVTEDGIRIADEEYQLLLLPPVTHLKQATFTMIRKIVEKGLGVVADRLLPVDLLESESDTVLDELKDFFTINPKRLLENFETSQKEENRVQKLRDNLYLFRGEGLARGRRRKELGQFLSQCLTPDVIIDHEDVFYLHRQSEKLDVYFLVNTVQKELGEIEISLEQTGQPELWDPQSGEIRPIPIFRIKNGRLLFRLPFSASEAHLVVIRKPVSWPYIVESNTVIDSFDGKTIYGFLPTEDNKPYVKLETQTGRRSLEIKNCTGQTRSIDLGKRHEFRIEDDNVLCLSQWKMRIQESGDDIDAFTKPDFDDSLWLDVTNGAWEMQLPFERDTETYPVTLWYRTEFSVTALTNRTALLIDGFKGREYQLFVNGHRLTSKPQRSRLDAEIKEVDIRQYLQEGYNVVTVKLIATGRYDGILDLLKIVGDFALEKRHEEYRITILPAQIKVGDWGPQGFPYYSGSGVYVMEFDLDQELTAGKLFLEADCGEDVLEVKINDQPPVTIPWHPYRLDITRQVTTGKNRLQLKVTNTSINILEGVEKASGLFRAPRIYCYPRYRLDIDNA